MFENKKENELRDMYVLILNHTESLKNITQEMEPFIKERGEALFNDKNLAKDPISTYNCLIFRICSRADKTKERNGSLS